MWNTISSIIQGIVEAVLDFLWGKVDKPSTLNDEQVPAKLKHDVDNDIANKLREQHGSNTPIGPPPGGE